MSIQAKLHGDRRKQTNEKKKKPKQIKEQRTQTAARFENVKDGRAWKGKEALDRHTCARVAIRERGHTYRRLWPAAFGA